jgi:hypothetical protein
MTIKIFDKCYNHAIIGMCNRDVIDDVMLLKKTGYQSSIESSSGTSFLFIQRSGTYEEKVRRGPRGTTI